MSKLLVIDGLELKKLLADTDVTVEIEKNDAYFPDEIGGIDLTNGLMLYGVTKTTFQAHRHHALLTEVSTNDHYFVWGMCFVKTDDNHLQRIEDSKDSKSFGYAAHFKIEALGVMPAFRGREYGAFLMHEVERYFITTFWQGELTGAGKLVTKVVFLLESIFLGHTDDRVVHFYSRLGYVIREMLMGSIWMRKILNVNKQAKAVTLRECAREHCLYELDQHDTVSHELNNLLRVNNNALHPSALAYRAARDRDACRRYLQIKQHRRWTKWFPDLKRRILEWRVQLRRECFDLAKFQSDETQEQQNKASSDAARLSSLVYYKAREMDEQEFKRVRALEQKNQPLQLKPLNTMDYDLLLSLKTPRLVHSDAYLSMDLRQLVAVDWKVDLDDEFKAVFNTDTESFYGPKWYDTPWGVLLWQLMDSNMVHSVEELTGAGGQLIAREILIENTPLVLVHLTSDSMSLEPVINRTASLLTNTNVVGNALLYPGALPSQAWYEQAMDASTTLEWVLIEPL